MNLLALQIDPSNNSKLVIRHGLEVAMPGSQAQVVFLLSFESPLDPHKRIGLIAT